MKELHLFDFDGTLFRSPDEPPWWPADKGNFFGHPDSIGRPCVPDHPDDSWWVSSVVAAARKAISDRDVLAILCTGRQDGFAFRWRIPELLKQKGLDFDGVFLNRRSSVQEHKTATVIALVRKFPGIRTVQMWEDARKNVDAVGSAIVEMGLTFKGHLVKTPAKPAACSQKTYLESDPWANDPVSRVAARWLLEEEREPVPNLSGA